MNKLGITILAAAIATAFAAAASAQTETPRDASRPPAETATTPPVSPRDQPDRKDIDKDRSDAELAIERKCNELPEDARERCIKAARAQLDRSLPSGGTAATPPPPSSSTPLPSAPPPSASSPTPGAPPSSPTPGAPPSGSPTGASPSTGTTGTTGTAAPAGGARR